MRVISWLAVGHYIYALLGEWRALDVITRGVRFESTAEMHTAYEAAQYIRVGI